MNRILDDYETVYGERPEHIDTVLAMDDIDVNNERVYMLGRSIKLMAQADIVIFSSRYKKGKGCLVEEMVAKLYGIKRYYHLATHGCFIHGCPNDYTNDNF
jgi:hypothetical protein